MRTFFEFFKNFTRIVHSPPLFTRYCRLADMKKDCTKYIFRAATTTRNINILRNCERLLNIGVKHKRLGVHSLCSGGATAAANLQVKDKLF